MIYLIISTIIDILLSTNITNTYKDINYFFPLILITSIPISYILTKNKTIFLILIILIGIIYDLLYSDIILINVYFLVLQTLLINQYYKKNKPNIINIITLSTLGLITYDLYISLILILTKYQTITIKDIIYKETHSIIINIIYLTISLIVLKSRILRNKKSLNKWTKYIKYSRW